MKFAYVVLVLGLGLFAMAAMPRSTTAAAMPLTTAMGMLCAASIARLTLIMVGRVITAAGIEVGAMVGDQSAYQHPN
jgi:hypothetical protein